MNPHSGRSATNAENQMGFATKALHAGYHPKDGWSLVMPLVQSVAFPFDSLEQAKGILAHEEQGHAYGRPDNPTCEILNRRLAALDGGEAAVVVASGMAATFTLAFQLLGSGDEIVSSQKIYGGTHHLFGHLLPTKLGVKTHWVTRPDDLSMWEKAITSKTRILWVETPSNPTLTVLDMAALAELAHSRGILLIADNTVATPYLQQPLALGADIIVYSTTKCLCGNSTSLGGAIVGSRERIETLIQEGLTPLGGVMSPFNAWLTLLGLETLPLRMDRHCTNALTVATWLQQNPKVKYVHYPGLPDSLYHALARRQMPRGFGPLLSFAIDGGIREAGRILERFQLITHATHLGTSVTLAMHPATTSHRTLTSEERSAAGIPDGLIRISVGLEDPQDIMADLDQAISKR